MFILKLGGSIITRKAKKNCFRQDIMDNLAKEIKEIKSYALGVAYNNNFSLLVFSYWLLALDKNRKNSSISIKSMVITNRQQRSREDPGCLRWSRRRRLRLLRFMESSTVPPTRVSSCARTVSSGRAFPYRLSNSGGWLRRRTLVAPVQSLGCPAARPSRLRH